MNLELITITQDNVHWAVNENWTRILEALRFKVPLNGVIKLEGNLDCNTNQLGTVEEAGPQSAQPAP